MGCNHDIRSVKYSVIGKETKSNAIIMKVTGIKSFSVADSGGKPYFFVKVERDDGIYGLGEVGIHRWGASIAKAIEHLSEVVVGADPFSTERLWQRMFRGASCPPTRSTPAR